VSAIRKFRPWHEAAERRRGENVRSARVIQTSICSTIAMVSSTSMPRYLTVLSMDSAQVAGASIDQRRLGAP
jgi:hypothetical protein